ncbi:MAG: apolipoprotein N-acyltransferase [Bdellovibrionaceae bacterium]|nr:apolipoprotein N-acyltransferase [Pseudobdellovibrionaceae bacterium]
MNFLQILKQFFKEYQLPILSGLLIGTSYIPFPPWAGCFGFIPLWIYWSRSQSIKKVIFSGWLSQFILTSIGFSWIAYNIHEFGALPWSVSILGMAIFCSFANYFIPVAGGLWWMWFGKKNPKSFLSVLALGLIMAISETYLQTIFKWNFAYSWMWAKIPIYQWAEFIGFQGLSSFFIIINALFLWMWFERKKTNTKFYLAGTLSTLFLLTLIGHQLPKRWKEADSVFRPLIVQANISNQQKVYAERGIGFRKYILDKFIELTASKLDGIEAPDFAVWPETAFPDYLNLGFGIYKRQLQNFLIEKQLPLITGGYAKHPKQQSSNSLFFIKSDGEFSDEPYHKTTLLAFGEYIPGASSFPFLKKLLPMIADFKRGEGPSVKEFENIKIGPQICYESLYPDFSYQLALKGAEVIINVTNDSWFGWWQEPYQHLIMTLARGIEFRRPVIRSTNTGISTVMLATGETLTHSPLGSEWAHTYAVTFKKNPPLTFYAQSYYLIPIILFLSLFMILFLTYKRSPSE